MWGSLIRRVVGAPWVTSAMAAVAIALIGSGNALAAEPALKGELTLRLAHQGNVTAIVFAPDGAIVASAGTDRTIKLWNVRSGALIRTLNEDFQPAALVFTPDDKTLIAGVPTGLHFWDTGTGAQKNIPPAPVPTREFPWVQALAISPDGKLILTGARSDMARVWDVATGRMVYTLPAETKGATQVAFAAGGKQALVGHGLGISRLPQPIDSAGTARWYYIETGAALPTTVGDTLKLLSAISPQANQLVFKQEDRQDVEAFGRLIPGRRVVGTTLMLWDAAAGTVHPVAKVPAIVRSLTYSADGKLLAGVVGANRITVWNGSTGAVKTQFEMPGTVEVAALSPDGTVIAGGDHEGAVVVQPVAGGAPRWSVVGAAGQVTGVGILPDGKTIVSGQRSGVIAVWDAITGSLKKAIPIPDHQVSALVLSPDGKTLAAALPWKTFTLTMEEKGETSERIDLFDTTTWMARRTLSSSGPSGFDSLAFSPDSHLLAASAHDAVLLWDAASGEPKPLPGRFILQNGLAFSPSGTLFAVGENGIPVYDLPAFVKRERELGIGGNHNWPVFTADSKTLITANESGELEFWKVEGVDQDRSHPTFAKMQHPAPIMAIAVSSDGQWIASGDRDGTIFVWDAATGEKKATLLGHHGPVSSLQFWPGAPRLVSGSGDGTTRIWDVDRGKLLLSTAMIPPPPTDTAAIINWVAWTPDGYYDSSPGAAPYLSWLIDGRTVSDDTARTAFHRPGLLAVALK